MSEEYRYKDDYPYRDDPAPPFPPPPRRARHSCSGATRLYLSVLFIGAGLLLFLSNLGLFPLHSFWQLWPLILVAIGAGRWSDSPSSTNRLWSAALIVFGLLFFCVSMGWLHLRAHGASWPFAILLITFGFLILNPRRHLPSTPAAPGDDPSKFGPDFLTDTAVFGGVKRRVETLNLRGGNLLAVMGSVELDLRRAQLIDPSQPVVVEAICVFGAIKLRIPESWRVSIAGTQIFGAYEDKTAPLVRPDLITGTLVISGATIFGAVEIEN